MTKLRQSFHRTPLSPPFTHTFSGYFVLRLNLSCVIVFSRLSLVNILELINSCHCTTQKEQKYLNIVIVISFHTNSQQISRSNVESSKMLLKEAHSFKLFVTLIYLL